MHQRQPRQVNRRAAEFARAAEGSRTTLVHKQTKKNAEQRMAPRSASHKLKTATIL